MKKLNLLFALVLMASSVFAQANVTFQADMTIEIGQHRFDAATQKLYVTGDFTGWSTVAGTALELTDADADKIYTGTYPVDQATYPTINYKFIYPKIDETTQWEDKIGNRTFDISAGGDLTIPVSVFDNLTYAGANATVTFNCDMTLYVNNSTFIPGTHKLWIAGSFTDWQNSRVELTAGADNVYSATVTQDNLGANLVGGQTLQYKYLFGDADFTNVTWEDGDNRTWFTHDGASTATRFFNDMNPTSDLGDGNVLFQVDMRVLEEIGIFDPAVDFAEVRGGFNAWTGGEDATMIQDPFDANLWTRNHPFEQIQVGSEQLYKYFALLAVPGIWLDAWERPLSQGGGNRGVDFEATNDQVIAPVYYDDVDPRWVIPAGTNVAITFSVDMANAMDPALIALPFDPTIDQLWWIAEQPSFVRTQGWTDGDNMQVLQMTDPDGDYIFTGTLNVTAPSFNAFEYRYGFIDATDGAWILEPAGYGDFAYRVRFIGMSGDREFIQPFNATQDSWANQEDKSDQQDAFPLVGVEPINVIANSYQLEQNYPNPFNPETTIRFSLPQANLVTIKVYNTLGQEVATVLTKELATGTYEVPFNAKNLASGIYFYNIKAGDFSATRKMMLLK
ncbi:MAG: T9SS type A sorting domain-containing protein [bacterium]